MNAPSYDAVERDGRFNCQTCNTRGNVSMDSDGVYRCSLCSKSAWYAETARRDRIERGVLTLTDAPKTIPYTARELETFSRTRLEGCMAEYQNDPLLLAEVRRREVERHARNSRVGGKLDLDGPFVVESGVKGAMRIGYRAFATLDEAQAFAARVRSANSTGDYWAHVYQSPRVWESRESYNERTGAKLASVPWTKIVEATVAFKNGDKAPVRS